jgi:hypothetical protein
MRITDRGSVVDRGLGWLGLFLLGLTGWAAERLQERTPIAGVPARLVLRCVTAVGWVIDRLPVPDPYRRNLDDGPKARAIRSNIRAPHVCVRGGVRTPRLPANVAVRPPRL